MYRDNSAGGPRQHGAPSPGQFSYYMPGTSYGTNAPSGPYDYPAGIAQPPWPPQSYQPRYPTPQPQSYQARPPTQIPVQSGWAPPPQPSYPGSDRSGTSTVDSRSDNETEKLTRSILGRYSDSVVTRLTASGCEEPLDSPGLTAHGRRDVRLDQPSGASDGRSRRKRRSRDRDSNTEKKRQSARSYSKDHIDRRSSPKRRSGSTHASDKSELPQQSENTTVIYMGNISNGVSAEEIKHLVNGMTGVSDIVFAQHRDAESREFCAFIDMMSKVAARDLIMKFHGFVLYLQPLVVRLAEPRDYQSVTLTFPRSAGTHSKFLEEKSTTSLEYHDDRNRSNTMPGEKHRSLSHHSNRSRSRTPPKEMRMSSLTSPQEIYRSLNHHTNRSRSRTPSVEIIGVSLSHRGGQSRSRTPSQEKYLSRSRYDNRSRSQTPSPEKYWSQSRHDNRSRSKSPPQEKHRSLGHHDDRRSRTRPQEKQRSPSYKKYMSSLSRRGDRSRSPPSSHKKRRSSPWEREVGNREMSSTTRDSSDMSSADLFLRIASHKKRVADYERQHDGSIEGEEHKRDEIRHTKRDEIRHTWQDEPRKPDHFRDTRQEPAIQDQLRRTRHDEYSTGDQLRDTSEDEPRRSNREEILHTSGELDDGQYDEKMQHGPGEITCRLREMIDDNESPMLGLRFITERQCADPSNSPKYTCSLCDCNCGINFIVPHITGLQHRTKFMERFHVEEYKQIANIKDRMEKRARIEYHAKLIEVDIGREEINVVQDEATWEFELPKKKGPADTENPQKKQKFDDSLALKIFQILKKGNAPKSSIESVKLRQPTEVQVGSIGSYHKNPIQFIERSAIPHVDTVGEPMTETPNIGVQVIEHTRRSSVHEPWSGTANSQEISIPITGRLEGRNSFSEQRSVYPHVIGLQQIPLAGPQREEPVGFAGQQWSMPPNINSFQQFPATQNAEPVSFARQQQNVPPYVNSFQHFPLPGIQNTQPVSFASQQWNVHPNICGAPEIPLPVIQRLQSVDVNKQWNMLPNIGRFQQSPFQGIQNTEPVRRQININQNIGNFQQIPLSAIQKQEPERFVGKQRNVKPNPQEIVSPASETREPICELGHDSSSKLSANARPKLDGEHGDYLDVLKKFEDTMFPQPSSKSRKDNPCLCGLCGFRGATRHDVHQHITNQTYHFNTHILDNHEIFKLKPENVSSTYSCSRCIFGTKSWFAVLSHITYTGRPGHQKEQTPVLCDGFLFNEKYKASVREMLKAKLEIDGRNLRRTDSVPDSENPVDTKLTKKNVDKTETTSVVSVVETKQTSSDAPTVATGNNAHTKVSKDTNQKIDEKVNEFFCTFCGFHSMCRVDVEKHQKIVGHEDAMTIDWVQALSEVADIRLDKTANFSCSICGFGSDYRNLVMCHVKQADTRTHRLANVVAGRSSRGSTVSSKLTEKSVDSDRDTDVCTTAMNLDTKTDIDVTLDECHSNHGTAVQSEADQINGNSEQVLDIILTSTSLENDDGKPTEDSIDLTDNRAAVALTSVIYLTNPSEKKKKKKKKKKRRYMFSKQTTDLMSVIDLTKPSGNVSDSNTNTDNQPSIDLTQAPLLDLVLSSEKTLEPDENVIVKPPGDVMQVKSSRNSVSGRGTDMEVDPSTESPEKRQREVGHLVKVTETSTNEEHNLDDAAKTLLNKSCVVSVYDWLVVKGVGTMSGEEVKSLLNEYPYPLDSSIMPGALKQTFVTGGWICVRCNKRLSHRRLDALTHYKLNHLPIGPIACEACGTRRCDGAADTADTWPKSRDCGHLKTDRIKLQKTPDPTFEGDSENDGDSVDFVRTARLEAMKCFVTETTVADIVENIVSTWDINKHRSVEGHRGTDVEMPSSGYTTGDAGVESIAQDIEMKTELNCQTDADIGTEITKDAALLADIEMKTISTDLAEANIEDSKTAEKMETQTEKTNEEINLDAFIRERAMELLQEKVIQNKSSHKYMHIENVCKSLVTDLLKVLKLNSHEEEFCRLYKATTEMRKPTVEKDFIEQHGNALHGYIDIHRPDGDRVSVQSLDLSVCKSLPGITQCRLCAAIGPSLDWFHAHYKCHKADNVLYYCSYCGHYGETQDELQAHATATGHEEMGKINASSVYTSHDDSSPFVVIPRKVVIEAAEGIHGYDLDWRLLEDLIADRLKKHSMRNIAASAGQLKLRYWTCTSCGHICPDSPTSRYRHFVLMHTRQAPYTCSTCRLRSTNKDQVVSHRKSACHSDGWVIQRRTAMFPLMFGPQADFLQMTWRKFHHLRCLVCSCGFKTMVASVMAAHTSAAGEGHKDSLKPLTSDSLLEAIREWNSVVTVTADGAKVKRHRPLQWKCNLCKVVKRVDVRPGVDPVKLHLWPMKHYLLYHSPEPPYFCGLCGFKAITRERVMKHIYKWKHGSEYEILQGENIQYPRFDLRRPEITLDFCEKQDTKPSSALFRKSRSVPMDIDRNTTVSDCPIDDDPEDEKEELACMFQTDIPVGEIEEYKSTGYIMKLFQQPGTPFHGNPPPGHLWKCTSCGMCVSTYQLSLAHFQHYHSRSPSYQCGDCGFPAWNLRYIERHLHVSRHNSEKLVKPSLVSFPYFISDQRDFVPVKTELADKGGRGEQHTPFSHGDGVKQYRTIVWRCCICNTVSRAFKHLTDSAATLLMDYPHIHHSQSHRNQFSGRMICGDCGVHGVSTQVQRHADREGHRLVTDTPFLDGPNPDYVLEFFDEDDEVTQKKTVNNSSNMQKACVKVSKKEVKSGEKLTKPAQQYKTSTFDGTTTVVGEDISIDELTQGRIRTLETDGKSHAMDVTTTENVIPVPEAFVADTENKQILDSESKSHETDDNLPRAKDTEIKSSEKVETPDKKVKPPEKEIRLPETDGKSPEKEIKLPESDGNSPEKETRLPESDGKSPEKEVKLTGKDGKSPEKEVKLPENDGKSPDKEIKLPGNDGKSPEKEVKLPENDGKSPEKETRLPESDGKSPEKEVKLPENDGKSPDKEIKLPESDGKSPEKETRLPESDEKSPEKEVKLTGKDGKSPEKEVKLPENDGKSPDKEIKLPGNDGKSPEKEVKLPENDGKSPEKEVKLPENDGKSPEKETRLPESDGKSPEKEVKLPENDGKSPDKVIKLPESDGKSPEKETRLPESDGKSPEKEVKLTGKDGKSPEKEVKLPESDGKSPMKEIKLPGNDGKSPEKEVKLPENDGKSPDKEVKLPENDGKSPDKEVKLPENDGKSPDKEVKLSGNDGKSPEKETRFPESDGKPSEKETKLPRNVGKSPEKEVKLPESDGKSPDKDTKLPVNYGKSPEKETSLPESDGKSPAKETKVQEKVTSPKSYIKSPHKEDKAESPVDEMNLQSPEKMEEASGEEANSLLEDKEFKITAKDVNAKETDIKLQSPDDDVNLQSPGKMAKITQNEVKAGQTEVKSKFPNKEVKSQSSDKEVTLSDREVKSPENESKQSVNVDTADKTGQLLSSEKVKSLDTKEMSAQEPINLTAEEVETKSQRIEVQSATKSEPFEWDDSQDMIADLWRLSTKHEYQVTPGKPLYFIKADGLPKGYVWQCRTCYTVLPLDDTIPHFMTNHAPFSCTECGVQHRLEKDIFDHYWRVGHLADTCYKMACKLLPLFYGPQADFFPLVNDKSVALNVEADSLLLRTLKTYRPMYWRCLLCGTRELVPPHWDVEQYHLTGRLHYSSVRHFIIQHSRDAPYMCSCGHRAVNGADMDMHRHKPHFEPPKIKRGHPTIPNLVGKNPDIILTMADDFTSRDIQEQGAEMKTLDETRTTKVTSGETTIVGPDIIIVGQAPNFLPADNQAILEKFLWKCSLCGVVYKIDEAREHFRHFHSQTPLFSCGQCNFRANNGRDMDAHLAMSRHPVKKVINRCNKPSFIMLCGPQADLIPVCVESGWLVGVMEKNNTAGELIKKYKPMGWHCRICGHTKMMPTLRNTSHGEFLQFLKGFAVKHFQRHLPCMPIVLYGAQPDMILVTCDDTVSGNRKQGNDGSKTVDQTSSHGTHSSTPQTTATITCEQVTRIASDQKTPVVCTTSQMTIAIASDQAIIASAASDQSTIARATSRATIASTSSQATIANTSDQATIASTSDQLTIAGTSDQTTIANTRDQAVTNVGVNVDPHSMSSIGDKKYQYVTGKTIGGESTHFMDDEYPSPSTNSIWTCTSCGMNLPLTRTVLHYIHHHRESPMVSCSVCGFRGEIVADVHVHMTSAHRGLSSEVIWSDDLTYPFFFGPQADFIPYRGTGEPVMWSQMIACKPGEVIKRYVEMDWVCKLCGEAERACHDGVSPTKDFLANLGTWPRQHYVKKHSRSAPFTCRICLARFYKESSIRIHCTQEGHDVKNIIRGPLNYKVLNKDYVELVLRRDMNPANDAVKDTVGDGENKVEECAASEVLEMDGGQGTSNDSRKQVKDSQVTTKDIVRGSDDGVAKGRGVSKDGTKYQKENVIKNSKGSTDSSKDHKDSIVKGSKNNSTDSNVIRNVSNDHVKDKREGGVKLRKGSKGCVKNVEDSKDGGVLDKKDIVRKGRKVSAVKDRKDLVKTRRSSIATASKDNVKTVVKDSVEIVVKTPVKVSTDSDAGTDDEFDLTDFMVLDEIGEDANISDDQVEKTSESPASDSCKNTKKEDNVPAVSSRKRKVSMEEQTVVKKKSKGCTTTTASESLPGVVEKSEESVVTDIISGKTDEKVDSLEANDEPTSSHSVTTSVPDPEKGHDAMELEIVDTSKTSESNEDEASNVIDNSSAVSDNSGTSLGNIRVNAGVVTDIISDVSDKDLVEETTSKSTVSLRSPVQDAIGNSSSSESPSKVTCICPDCGKVCKSKGGLVSHQRVHKK